MVQRVTRLPAISTKGPPATEDPFAKLLLGLPFGHETGAIDPMVNHALAGWLLQPSDQSACQPLASPLPSAKVRYHVQKSVTRCLSPLPCAAA